MKNGLNGMSVILHSKEKFPSVSVLLPVHRKSPERTTDPEELRKALAQAQEQLYQVCQDAVAETLAGELHRLALKIDFVHDKEGIGLFVSPLVSVLVHFPFPVKSRIMIGDRFELRNVLYMSQLFPAYALLTLSQKEARLLKGEGEMLAEVNDGRFPFRFTDDYIYNGHSLGTSFGYAMKWFERDKGILKRKRQQAFLRTFNMLLQDYLADGRRLVLAGTERNLLDYSEVIDKSLRPLAVLYGNFDHHSPAQLRQLALPLIEAAMQKENLQLFSKLKKAADDKMMIAGITGAWKAASEGKGLHLLVERDYWTEAYVESDPTILLFNKPASAHTLLNDAVESLIRLVWDKNGEVSIVENGSLKQYERVALLLRYS